VSECLTEDGGRRRKVHSHNEIQESLNNGFINIIKCWNNSHFSIIRMPLNIKILLKSVDWHLKLV
jgi:hypothetical protein